MLLLHVSAQTRVVSWSPRGSGTTTTLLASPRYAYSSSPLQGLSYSCTYGLIWFHLCLFIFRKIYKPLDLLVFQLLVKVGSFVTWPGFLYVWEDCDCGWIFEIVGTRGSRSVSYCWRDCLSQNAKDMRHFASMQKIPEAPLLCRQIFGSVNPDPEPFIFFGSVAGSEAVRSSSSGPSPGSEAVHSLWVRHRTWSRPFIFFGSSSEPEPSVIFSGIRNRIRSRIAVWATYRKLVELTIPTLIHQVV